MLCRSNGVKIYSKISERSLGITGACMFEIARTWVRFVSSRQIPYLNISNYEMKRVLLIYSIMHELPINVESYDRFLVVSRVIANACIFHRL